MRIDSMDATLKSQASITSAQSKKETAVNAEKTQVPVNAGSINQEIGSYTEEKVSDAFIQKAIDKVNHTFEIQNRSLRFEIHDRLNEVIVMVVDSETEEVIREIPPEKLLDMFANLLELAGLLVDERR